MLLSKKIDQQKDFVAVSEDPPILSFCLGWRSNFVGFESDQKQSVKLRSIWSPTQLNSPRPLQATQCLNILYFDFGKGGRVGEVNHKAGSKIPT
jgi:hypothetical protein